MKKIEFKIQVWDSKSFEERSEIVSGYQFEIEKYPGHQFVAHKSWRDKDRWSVSEKTTGYAIVQSRSSRKEAIQDCINALNEHTTPEWFDECVKNPVTVLPMS